MRSESEWLDIVRNLVIDAVPGTSEAEGPPVGDIRPLDLLLVRDKRELAIEVKVVRAPRISEVEGQLARFALRKQQEEPRSPATIDIIIVALAKFGPKLEAAIRAFAGRYAANIGWGLIDESDHAVLVIPHLGIDWSRASAAPIGHRPRLERRDRKLFTDLNRWMLKILMLRNAPSDQWGGPRRTPKHPTDLANLAQVSISKAHHFATTFQEEGFLRGSEQELRLVRLDALLDAWLQDEKNSSPKMTPVRSLLPSRMPLFPDSTEGEPPLPPEAHRWSVIGGTFAAIPRGLLHVSGRHVPFVHLRKSLPRAMRDWSFESCSRQDAQMILVQPLYPRSVFRGAVAREQGAPLVDLWQVALDAVTGGPRGGEQAEFISERVLALQGRR